MLRIVLGNQGLCQGLSKYAFNGDAVLKNGFNYKSLLNEPASKNLYEVLGCKKSDDPKTIKKKYFELAKKYHPDQNPNNAEAKSKFQEISSAYEILSDEKKRRLYDETGSTDSNAFGGGGAGGGGDPRAQQEMYNRIMREMFGGAAGGFGGFGGFGQAQQQDGSDGEDFMVETEVLLKDVVSGVNKEIAFEHQVSCKPCSGTGAEGGKRENMSSCKACSGTGMKTEMRRTPLGVMSFQQTCGTCSGSGKVITHKCKSCKGEGRVKATGKKTVYIPPGVEDGMMLRLQDEGDAGRRGGRPGDLIVKINIKQDPKFIRQGQDVILSLPISLKQAILGDKVSIFGISGEEFEVKVPAGSTSEDILRLRQKGLPSVNSSSRGNLLVAFKLELPNSLTDKQKEYITLFQQEEDRKKGSTSTRPPEASSSDKKDDGKKDDGKKDDGKKGSIWNMFKSS